MKKLLSTLCTIIFIFTALSVVVHAASPSLTISTDNNVVKPGDTVQIKVFLNDNPGLYALCFEIPIDPNAFAYDGCEYTNSIFKLDSLSDYDPTTNSFKLNRCGESLFENVTEDGIVCTVKLKIKDSATSGEYDIRINPDHSNTINVDGNSVNIDGGGINITVNAPCKHTLKEVYAVPATCKTVGTIKHYHCTKCNRLFLDDTGTKEINDITEPINSNNHVGETEIKTKRKPPAPKKAIPEIHTANPAVRRWKAAKPFPSLLTHLLPNGKRTMTSTGTSALSVTLSLTKVFIIMNGL